MSLPRPKDIPKKIPRWGWDWLRWRLGKKKPKPLPPAPKPGPGPIKGIDYAWAHPNPAAIKAGGYKFVFRYLSTDNSKDLSLTEAKALHAEGLSIGVVWESTSTRALDGYLAGKQDAQEAANLLKACGAPGTVPIYFALDFDLKDYAPLSFSAIKKLGPVASYFAGIHSVLPAPRVGAYGGYWAIKRLFDAKLINFGWQTTAWSGGHWDARAQVRQVGGVTVGGVKCDLNTALVPNYGQWAPS